MFINVLKLILISLVSCLLVACGSVSGSQNQQSEDVAASQLFHSDVSALNVSRGPLLEGLVGQEVDQIMDAGDRDNMLVSIINASVNQTVSWVNDRRHIHYQLTLISANWSNQGIYCRQYQVAVLAFNEIKHGQGRLCKVGKNTWQIMPLMPQLARQAMPNY